MQTGSAIGLLLLALAAPSTSAAQVPARVPDGGVVDARVESARRALRRPVIPFTTDRQSVPGWDRVQALRAGRDVRLTLESGATVDGRLVSADLTGVVLRVPGERRPRSVARADVVSVSARGPARGSKAGAIAAAGAGAFLGVVTAINLAYKNCGGDCSDERVLIGASLVGMPLAGGWLGYRLFARPGSMETIYRRP